MELILKYPPSNCTAPPSAINNKPQLDGFVAAAVFCGRRIQRSANENRGTRYPCAYRGSFDHRSAIAAITGQSAQRMPPARIASGAIKAQGIVRRMVEFHPD